MNQSATFTPGKRYRLWAKTPPQRNERVYVVTCLGDAGESIAFDARPFAGTQTIRRDQIVRAELVPDNTPHSIRVVRS